MKKLMKLMLALSLTSTFATTTALSQELWIFDELGNGLLTGGPIVGFSNGTNKVDPASGISTLWYNVGVPAVLGDVVLFEPGNTNFSDLIRFDGQGGMFFFSDREPGDINPDPADVFQLPPVFGANVVFLNEVGTEGNNGVFYTPLPGKPGFDPTGTLPGLQYHFISDVPEPSSAALAVCGAVLWGVRRIRRRRRY